jgi:hypothetical protein
MFNRIKKIFYIILLIFQLSGLMLYSKVSVYDLNISLYKLVNIKERENRFIWINWRIPEWQLSDLKRSNKMDNSAELEKIKKSCINQEIIEIGKIRWRHYRSLEEAVPRRMVFYFFDGSFYSFRFEGTHGKYSLHLYKEVYELIKGEFIRQPSSSINILKKNDFSLDTPLHFRIGDEEYCFIFKIMEVPNPDQNPLQDDMDFTIAHYKPIEYPKKILKRVSGIEEALIDANMGVYGKFETIENRKGKVRIIKWVKGILPNLLIDRVIYIPTKFYLRSKFVFIGKTFKEN